MVSHQSIKKVSEVRSDGGVGGGRGRGRGRYSSVFVQVSVGLTEMDTCHWKSYSENNLNPH